MPRGAKPMTALVGEVIAQREPLNSTHGQSVDPALAPVEGGTVVPL
jgi:hypothetical protein